MRSPCHLYSFVFDHLKLSQGFQHHLSFAGQTMLDLLNGTNLAVPNRLSLADLSLQVL